MPFEPGQSGNPGGRAKGKPWREALLRAVMRREPLEATLQEGDRPQRIDLMAEAIVNRAIDGDVAASREIGDRLEGKAVQAIEGADGGPLVVQTIRLSDIAEPPASADNPPSQ